MHADVHTTSGIRTSPSKYGMNEELICLSTAGFNASICKINSTLQEQLCTVDDACSSTTPLGHEGFSGNLGKLLSLREGNMA